jgi:NAD(P)H-dependent FMN reductase
MSGHDSVQTVKRPLNVLGLVGSPRRLGNSEVFIKAISMGIREEHRLSLIRLPSLKILPCKACYSCIVGKPCPQEDHMHFLLEQIADADAVILAAPVYFLGTHSIIKAILDRGFLFFDYLGRTHGKPCILANFYGMKERMGVAPQTLRSFASFFAMNIRGSVNIRADLPGEALRSKKNAALVEMLARRLFSREKLKPGTGCPFCGCEIVRMEKKDFICTLCHGRFTLDSRHTPVKVREGVILGPPGHMLKHRAWLGRMKEKFFHVRKDLVRFTSSFNSVGEWIEPGVEQNSDPGR